MYGDRYYLELALAQAESADREGSLPIGAVVVGPDGQVLGEGRNRIFSAGDPTCHAEIDALRRAGPLLSAPQYSGRSTLYTTLEPCLMCTGAILLASVGRLIWLVDDTGYGALRELQDGTLYADLFTCLTVAKASEPDLERRVCERLADCRREPQLALHQPLEQATEFRAGPLGPCDRGALGSQGYAYARHAAPHDDTRLPHSALRLAA